MEVAFSHAANSLPDPEQEERHKAFLWSVQEAAEKHTMQIGVSACGATAVVDVLQALGIRVTPETADRSVQTKLRRNNSPLADYLHSRSEAGATHKQLIDGAEEASGGRVIGRFFGFYPPRKVNLVSWLAHWIRRRAAPVATMNMQCGVAEGEEIPDAWHHQLIFGVAPSAVFMTNPLDVVSGEELRLRLCSESVLLIRREDVLKRITADSPLSLISDHQDDPRWKSVHVEGAVTAPPLGSSRIVGNNVICSKVSHKKCQVKKMLEEENCEEDHPKSTHITIPAAYSSGVTLFALRDSATGQELLSAPQLPLL